MNPIGEKIKLMRRKAGLSLEKLAAIVGMSRQGLSYVEKNGSKIVTLNRVAQALGTSLNEIIGDENDR